jgi:O-antigen/teichoic acid export membrane protein
MPPVAWSTIGKILQQTVSLLLFFILAPILGPEPYGQFAIVAVFMGFCELVLGQAGMEALLSMDPPEPQHQRTVNLSGLLAACVVGAVSFPLAPVIARVFGDDELAPLFKAMAVLPAIAVLTSVPFADLKSHLRFRPLALRTALGLVIGGVCGLVLALKGAGVWALAAQIIVQRGSEAVILWASANTRFSLGWSKRHFIDLRHFAANVFFSRGISFLGASIPRLILGFFLGPFELGLFVFAARVPDALTMVAILPAAEVSRVTLRQYVPGQKEMQEAFGRLIEDIALVALPMCCGGAAVMPLLIAIALDSRWQPAAFAAQMMILSVIPMLMFYVSTAVLLALKFPRDEAKLSLYQAVSGTVAVLLAAPFNVNVACFFLLFRHAFLMPILVRILAQRCGIEPRSIVAAISPALFVSLVMGGIVMLIAPAIEHRLGQLAAFPALISIGILVYAVLISIAAPQTVRRFIGNIRKLILRQSAASPAS